MNASSRARKGQVEILTAALGKVLEAAGVTHGTAMANQLSRTAYRETLEQYDDTKTFEPFASTADQAERMLRLVARVKR